MKINSYEPKVIKANKLFGVTFYQRKRIAENKVILDFEPVHCDDIGLYVIGKYPRLKYNSTSFNEDFNWQWHVIVTIRLTILNLINKGVIDVIKVEDKVTYLYKSFPRIDTDYYFKVTDIQKDKDWFSQLVYKTINEVNQRKKTNLFGYIKSILDNIIYPQSTYKNPARAFLIQILRKYTKAFPWIQIEAKSKYLGLLENHSLKVAEIYIPRISMQHQALSNTDNNLFRSSKTYANFCKCLNYEIEKDFKRRLANRN
ncbi:hypothetical protein [Winogradskyella sp. PE311]|uniref:hypothetical protein n=1 Tax=Winogradskyella sp. PE311 TaxID=3366943 RepID=UPI00397F0F2F